MYILIYAHCMNSYMDLRLYVYMDLCIHDYLFFADFSNCTKYVEFVKIL